MHGCLNALRSPSQNLQVVGTLRPEVAESLGLSKDVQVAPGSGDNQMSALGSGKLRFEISQHLNMTFASLTRMGCTCSTSRFSFGFQYTFCTTNFQLQSGNVQHV